ncbi:lysosome-associated membrane glycoprotein 3 isoform X6 [Pan troglodytes]|uniref:lysosome-associated membrane glycoprotein 3 isoform X6 n=1 Tax=Pan troglodytes TaxID=9598 RepID=UPI0005124C9E|nr:lysosome-associated membrane glycoprotein 3 isoform X5 [Pan troglodytes]
MPRQLSAAAALFASLAVILHDGSQMRAKAFPETRDYSQPSAAATVQDIKKPVQQPAKQAPHQTLAARFMDGHITFQTAATVKTPTTTPATTKNTATTSPITYTLVTTQATPNNSHTAPPVTEVTVGPSLVPYSLPPTITPPAHTTGTSSSTVSHTTGNTTQPSNQTTLPATLSIALHKSTTGQKPVQPTHAPGTTAAAHNTTRTAAPASTVPGPTLAPQPSSVKTGIYQVLNGSRLCIKAEMGIQLIVQDKESDEESYYISEVGAYLTVSDPETIYQGIKHAVVMFQTAVGHSFKCVSEQSLQLSAHLQLKTTDVQLQAFDFEDDHFGNVDECSSDYTIVLPVIGAIVVGLCLMGMGVYKIRLRCQSSGYQRI